MLPLLEGDILKDDGLLANNALRLVAARPLSSSLLALFNRAEDAHHEQTHQYKVVQVIDWDDVLHNNDYIVRPTRESRTPISRAAGSTSATDSSAANTYFRMKVLDMSDGLDDEAMTAVDAMMRQLCLLPINGNVTTIRAIFRSINHLVIIHDSLPSAGNVLADCVVHDWVGILSHSRLERIRDRVSEMCRTVQLCHWHGVTLANLNLSHFVIISRNPSGEGSNNTVLSLPHFLATRIDLLQKAGSTASTCHAADDVFNLGVMLLEQIYGSLPWTSPVDPLHRKFIANPRRFLRKRYMALSADLATFLGENVFGFLDQRISAVELASWVETNLVNGLTSYVGPTANFTSRGEARCQALPRMGSSLAKDTIPFSPSERLPEEGIKKPPAYLLDNFAFIFENWSVDELYWIAEHLSFHLERLVSEPLKQQVASTAARLLFRLCLRLRTLPSKLCLQDVRRDELGFRAQGGFSDVEAGNYNGKGVAIKHVRWATNSDPDMVRNLIVRKCVPVFILNALGTPHVLPLLGITSSKPAQPPSLVTPWMQGGTLKEYLKRNNDNMSDGDLLNMMLLIAEMLDVLHEMNFVHGDISLQNILTDARGTPRFSDFGLSAFADVYIGDYPTLNVGTVNYLAPELCGAPSASNAAVDDSVAMKVGRTKASDITALAGVLLEMWTGQKPYYQYQNVRLQIARGSLPLRTPKREEEFSRKVPDVLWELLKPCWAMDPSRRPSAAQVAAGLRKLILLPQSAVIVMERAEAAQVDNAKDTAANLGAANFLVAMHLP